MNNDKILKQLLLNDLQEISLRWGYYDEMISLVDKWKAVGVVYRDFIKAFGVLSLILSHEVQPR